MISLVRAVSSSRGSKRALRGLYYSSPFIRDLQNCPQLLKMFEECVGEPLLPHFCFSNSPQVNFSTPGSLSPVDHWHNDSIAYAGVVVISDMENMVGGELELFRGDKEAGKKMLREKKMSSEMVETVSYERPGKMILTHGSEVTIKIFQNMYSQDKYMLHLPANLWCSGAASCDPGDL